MQSADRLESSNSLQPVHTQQQNACTLKAACALLACGCFALLPPPSQEFENRFWTVLGFVGSTCMLFIPDSPFAIGQYSVTLGFVGVVLCTFGIHR